MDRLNVLIVDIALVSMVAIAFVHTDAVALLIGFTACVAVFAIVAKRLE